MRIIQSVKHWLTAALMAGALLAPLAVPAVALAVPDTGAVCQGVSLTGGGCDAGANSFSNTIKLVINILSIISAIAAVIMIIVGGLRYITSGGDSGKVASAKSSIIYAIIGLIIVALAQFIVRFVLFRVGK